MATKSEIIENLNWVTQRISDRIWTISVGILASTLTFVIESTRTDGVPFLLPQQVAVPAVLALLSLGCDLTQYMAANRQNYQLLRKMESEGLDEAKYDPRGFLGRIRIFAYRAKFYLCMTAILWFVAITMLRVLQIT